MPFLHGHWSLKKKKEKKTSCLEQSNVRIYARRCVVLIVQCEVAVTVLHR
jgi:hypothetical protein